MEYTEIIDGYQIRDVTYIGKPPKDTPIQYDIIKHVDCDPYEAINAATGKREMYSHYVFSVARLVWDRHEGWWQFRSVGTRWLEESDQKRVTDAVVNMVLKFAEEKAEELRYEDD